MALWLVIESYGICLRVLGRDVSARRTLDDGAWNLTYVSGEYTTHLDAYNVALLYVIVMPWRLVWLLEMIRVRVYLTALIPFIPVNDCLPFHCITVLAIWVIGFHSWDIVWVSVGRVSNGPTVLLSSTPLVVTWIEPARAWSWKLTSHGDWNGNLVVMRPLVPVYSSITKSYWIGVRARLGYVGWKEWK